MTDDGPADDEGSADAPADDMQVGTRRRSLLKTLPVSPLAAALAGCPDGDGFDTAGSTNRSPEGLPEDLSPGTTLSFAEAVSYPERYELTVRASGAGEEATTLTGRVADGDQYVRTQYSGGATETYVVDGRGYLVTGDRCVTYPASTAETGSEGGERDGSADDLRLAGRTTLDGREVYEFELTGAPDQQAPVPTYFVDVETGYLRRLEAGSTVVEYSSWGSAADVTPPAGDCTEYERPTGDRSGTPTPTDTPTPTETPTPTPAGTPTQTPTEVEGVPDDWENDQTKRYSVRERTGVQFDPAGQSLVLVAFQNLADFPVDVYTVSLESAAAVSTGDVDVDSVAIDALSFPGMKRGANVTELADGSYAVFIDNTGDIGPATPPSTDAVADVSLRIAYT